MYKLNCANDNCSKFNEIVYFQTATNPSVCGICQNQIIPIELTSSEVDRLFDYDFVVSDDIGLE
jgi:hypothetical protein